jgi:hypothetical protein
VIMTAGLGDVEGPVLKKPFGVDELLAVMPRATDRAEVTPSRVVGDRHGWEAVA